MPNRSSGTKERSRPLRMISSGSMPLSRHSLPSGSMYVILLPSSSFCRPEMASSSSFWPEPAMPAMPRISPPMAVKVTSSSILTPSLFLMVRCSTLRRSVWFSLSGRSMFSETARPTIMSVSDCCEAVAVSVSPMYSPLRRTATRSETASTSCSLCVMMMIALPSFFMLRMTVKSFSVSCGVRTAVGSSRIRMSAPR